MVNMEGMARRSKVKVVAKKTVKMKRKSEEIENKVANLIKFAEEIIENGLEYKNDSILVRKERQKV